MLITNIGDTHIGRLEEFLSLLDVKLKEIEKKISLACDAESEGLYDRAEYFVGVGFVAIQQYLLETLLFQGFEKKHKAWLLGQNLDCGYSDIVLMNAAANYWKHESEEYDIKFMQLKPDKKRSNYDAFVVIHDVTKNADYPLVEVLVILNQSNQLTLIELMPRLSRWACKIQLENDGIID